MNLGKLLGAGKSIIGGGKPAAYRTDRSFCLPQFVSPKNPFKNPAAAASPDESSESMPAISAGPVKKEPSWAKTQKISTPQPATPARPVRATTWVEKFNPISIFREALPTNKVALPVQAELSLEKVKVVHNDLSDADVEVVPMKSRPAREPEADQPGKKSWTDLGERIMKVTAL
jgi:hypothetical protein